MGFKQCKQGKCSYNKGIDGCPICPSCSAPPNQVGNNSENCVDCWSCEHDMGYIRGGLPNDMRERIAQLMKEEQEKMEIMIEEEEKQIVIEK